MKKLIFGIIIISISLNACSFSEKKDTGIETADSLTVIKEQIILEAQAWLPAAIENFFNQNRTEILEICTPEYEEYKMDAINVDYDGGMTVEQFQKKWSSKYNTNLDQIGKSFLLEGQDNGRIKVMKCEPDSAQNLKFYVEIQDLDFKMTHKRKIKVENTSNGFKIVDVEHVE